MIKKLLLNALIFSGLFASAQTFTATYDFAATTSVSGTTDPTIPPSVTGITCGSFVAVGTPTNPNSGGRFSFTNWPAGAPNGATTYSSMTGSISTTQYYEVTLTPVSGYTATLNSIGLKVQRSGTGIKSYAVRSSADSYANNMPASVTSGTNIIVAGTNEFFIVPDANAAYTGSLVDLTATTFTFANTTSFRFYGWNSEGSSGTFSIDDVVFSGSVSNGTVACASPTISAITGNSVICSNQSLNLSSSVSGDAPLTYTWTGAGLIATPNASATTISNAASGDYTLTVSNACGTASAAINATVNALPSVSVGSATICAGESATLTASGSATSYSWSTTETTSSIVVTPTTNVTYTVTGSDANCSAIAIAMVNVNSTPTISVNSATICAGSSATLTATGTATSYTWSTNETTAGIVVTPTTSPVTYSVVGANGCSTNATATATVEVNALPSVSVTSAVICAGNSATLTASGATSFVWSNGPSTSSVIVTPTNSPVSYTVTGTDANNCSSDAVATVTVNALPVVTLSLTPNLQCVSINSVALSGGLPGGGTYSGTGVTGGNFSPATAGVGTYTISYMYTDGNNCSNTATDVMTVDACTGIQTSNTDVVSIYPNPSNGLVVVKTPVLNTQVNIFDINGKNVFMQTATSMETSLDLSHLANGVYQLNIISENQSFNYKIMIHK